MKYLYLVVFISIACSNNAETVNEEKLKNIPQLTLAGVLEKLQGREFIIKPDTDDAGKWMYIENGYGYQNTVLITGEGPTAITSITATYSGDNFLIPKPGEFLANLASIQYEGAKPQDAKKWVLANSHRSADTSIGKVRFKLTESGSTKRLEVLIK